MQLPLVCGLRERLFVLRDIDRDGGYPRYAKAEQNEAPVDHHGERGKPADRFLGGHHAVPFVFSMACRASATASRTIGSESCRLRCNAGAASLAAGPMDARAQAAR